MKKKVIVVVQQVNKSWELSVFRATLAQAMGKDIDGTTTTLSMSPTSTRTLVHNVR